MTKEDAKTKWCPFAFKLGTLTQPTVAGGPDQIIASGPQNRGYTMDGPLPASMCIASACMAWRWSEGIGQTRVPPAVLGGDAWKDWVITDSTPDDLGRVEITKPQRDGYCGLAGAPQE